MNSLNVKVGDKGHYQNGTTCEVVYVMPKGGTFVTQGGPFVPQVHSPDSVVHNKSAGHCFNFIPEPKTVRVAVWLDEIGNPHCTTRAGDLPPHQQIYPETVVTLTVPQ